MSITPESKRYFSEVAPEWDSIRSEYFTEAVREAAIMKAYLRSDMVVADIGAGTGFLAAGLAPLVKKVYVIDGSEEMLETARLHLRDFHNLVYQQADGTAIPLPDESLDAVFANMYLHHCPDPLAAIREMARLLRPGGRLVITDMESHPYIWMKTEMADYWLGFDPQLVHSWFSQVDLVNVRVGPSGESCQSQSQDIGENDADKGVAHVQIFLAVGTKRLSGVRDTIRQHYGELASNGVSCCSSSQKSKTDCCASSELISVERISDEIFNPGYSPEDREVVPAEAADFALGCGNPVAIANLQPGENVLDIGSGGGLDAFLAARKVAPAGKVIGIDMTPAMLNRARTSAEKAGLKNVEFRQGTAESLPVEENSIDVILSNCVINLCEDKGSVFFEAARVLRTGGRLEISDMVTSGSFSARYRSNPANWGGCVFGALPEGEYLDLISQAGFRDIHTQRSSIAQELDGVKVYSLTISAVRG